MEWIIVLIMVIGVLSICGLIFSLIKDKDSYTLICFFIAQICMISACLIAEYFYSYKEIPAIEVYHGNTTLQTSYQDSVPIDSVVFYKNK